MKTGFDARLGRKLTVLQFKDHYGAKLDEQGYPRFRPTLHCVACDGALRTVGETSASVDAVWAHDPAPGTWCPIKALPAQTNAG